jgi:hypothetical protein
MLEDVILVLQPWDHHPDEPEEWYNKFSTYYLPLGYGRTLVRAFEAFVLAEHPEKANIVIVRGVHTAPASWTAASSMYNWRKRAQAWDNERANAVANTISEARAKLQEATVEAVDALKAALKNPRTAVNAAKEILDRGGVPSVTVHQVKLVPFTADDLALARMEIEEWLTQRPQKSLPE